MQLMLGMAHSAPRYTRRTDTISNTTLNKATNGDNTGSSSATPTVTPAAIGASTRGATTQGTAQAEATVPAQMGGGAAPENLSLNPNPGVTGPGRHSRENEENPNMLVYKKVRNLTYMYPLLLLLLFTHHLL